LQSYESDYLDIHTFKLVCPDSNYRSSGKLTYAEMMRRLIILAQSLLRDWAFSNLRCVWFCKSKYLIIHGKSVAMCEKDPPGFIRNWNSVNSNDNTEEEKLHVFFHTF